MPSLRQPAHRPHFRRIAGHPHVGTVGDTPPMQIILLSCGYDVLSVRTQVRLRCDPAQASDFGFWLPASPTIGSRRHNGRRQAVVLSGGTPGRPPCSDDRTSRPLTRLGRRGELFAEGRSAQSGCHADRDRFDPTPRHFRDKESFSVGIRAHQSAIITARQNAFPSRSMDKDRQGPLCTDTKCEASVLSPPIKAIRPSPRAAARTSQETRHPRHRLRRYYQFRCVQEATS